MTSSTTLMTFLVKTPPLTRSVNLLGSWDNFSKAYPMRKDIRRGADDWTGCYNFENIVCDGNVGLPPSTRQGGLKMGGKYWYYYQLDDDTEYHNPAEPSTTSCPMLPGQVMNVLNVPIHFSSSRQRHRNASVSSTSSEMRTMDPEDRYLNPRPAPKPTLASFSTPATRTLAVTAESSPCTFSASTKRSSHSRNTSLPSRNLFSRSFRLPRKPDHDGRGRSASPTHRPRGLRAAVHQLVPPKAMSPKIQAVRGRTGCPSSDGGHTSTEAAQRSNRVSLDQLKETTSAANSVVFHRSRSPTATIERVTAETRIKPLPLRRSIERPGDGVEPFAISSFQSHRKQRSRSREPSPLRRSPVLSEQPKAEGKSREGSSQPYHPLETLKEVLSPQKTPVWLLSTNDARKNVLDAAVSPSEDSHKRLPALSDAPSLALLTGEVSTSSMSENSKKLEGLESNLSRVVISDECLSSNVQSHFSHWTGTTSSSYASSQWSSVFLDGKSPAFSQTTGPSSHLTSPYEITSMPDTPDAEKEKGIDSVLVANRMPSIISSSTVSSYDNTAPSSPASEASDPTQSHMVEPTPLQKRYGVMLGGFGGFSGYQLPDDAHVSEATVKPQFSESTNLRPIHDISSQLAENGGSGRAVIHDFSHSTNMQELLTELRYLGDMIQE